MEIVRCDGGSLNCSNLLFALVPNPAPALILHAPVGGEQWPVGASRFVSWEAHNLTGTLTLDLLSGDSVVDTVSGVAVASNRFQYALPAGLPAGDRYTLRVGSDSAPSIKASSPSFTVDLNPPAPRKWTVLFYFDAAAFMQENDTLQSFLDLGRLTTSTNVNYLCEYARSSKYATNSYPWYGVKRFVMRPGITPDSTNAVQDLGELDMSDPNTLTDFITWAAENYPAENYFLIPSDHGAGWREGLLLDEEHGYKWMTTRELQQALDASKTSINILGLDMCVEGAIEIAHQLRNCDLQLLIASQYKESRNWPYLTVFQMLESKLAAITPEALAILFCDGFVHLHQNPLDNGTLAVTRLKKMAPLSAAMTGLADEMITNSANRAAVQPYAAAAKAAFHQAVPYCANTPVLQRQVNGLNIFFPAPTNTQSLAYTNYTSAVIDFAEDSHWKRFLDVFFDHLTNSWITEAYNLAAPAGENGVTEIDLLKLLEAIQTDDTNAWVTLLSEGDGYTVPGGSGTFPVARGQALTLSAFGYIHQGGLEPTTNHFVRWYASSGIAMARDRREATNTFTVNGNGVIMACFSEDKKSYDVIFTTEGNGGFGGTTYTDWLTNSVAAGGNCPAITAIPEPGFAFAGWGGDYPDTANPLTITNVQSDMTVIAYFWPAPPKLSAERAGSGLTLSWPVWPPGYVLESTADVVAGGGTVVPGVVTNRIVLPLTPTNHFFRLSQAINAWHSPYADKSP